MRWRKIAVNGLLVGSLYLLAANAALLASGKWAMIGPLDARLGNARVSAGVYEGRLSADYHNPKARLPRNAPDRSWSWAGVHWHGRHTTGGRTWLLRIDPLLGVVVALVLILYARRSRRRLDERRVGYCPDCNYDLRATHNHCPECGWAAATARAPESPVVGSLAQNGVAAIPPTTFAATTPIAAGLARS